MLSVMRAVGYRKNAGAPLEDVDVPDPTPGPRDLVVRVDAVSVNPVDTKVRRSRTPKDVEILGWDAVGVVEALGTEATQFRVGDRVYYAGAINRPGTNAELHVVDERIVGHAPKSATDAEAGALPLTTITAYELLFDRLRMARDEEASILVVGGAGGVGSILIQLARQLTKLRVIATASRPETKQWCLELGAHDVIDHGRPLSEQLNAPVEYVAALTQTEQHYAEIVKALKPQGALGIIDDPKALDLMMLKSKSLSFHWELMFTRSLHQTPDMAEQGRLLGEVAARVDEKRMRSTLGEVFHGITAENLTRAHALVESGRVRGKVVVTK